MRLNDKVILVTGSTTGIGEGMVRVFAREGAKVMIHGRSTPFTMTPECISSKAPCHSLSGEMRLSMGSRSILPVANREITFSQIGQLWEKLP